MSGRYIDAFDPHRAAAVEEHVTSTSLLDELWTDEVTQTRAVIVEMQSEKDPTTEERKLMRLESVVRTAFEKMGEALEQRPRFKQVIDWISVRRALIELFERSIADSEKQNYFVLPYYGTRRDSSYGDRKHVLAQKRSTSWQDRTNDDRYVSPHHIRIIVDYFGLVDGKRKSRERIRKAHNLSSDQPITNAMSSLDWAVWDSTVIKDLVLADD